ncbi:hypothetical protein PN836_009250 [Ningiella sp. W23]|uniref:hypothetical protein n=1 Tax=Ningiella sp. W23 TaxID=3023715 RepID=UPI0037571ABD
MTKLISALNENLQVVYRKAIDADAALDQLGRDGKGKFNTIFGDESPFITRSKRFKAYVEEVAGDVAGIAEQNQQAQNTELKSSNTIDHSQKQVLSIIVKKLELLLTTLEQFKSSLKAK